MDVLESQIRTNAPEFAHNRDRMTALVAPTASAWGS